MPKRFVIATFSTWVTPTVQIQKGDLWDPEDPVVTSHPDWFTDDPESADMVRRSDTSVTEETGRRRKPAPAAAPVEAATAEPGEKRTTTPPRARG